MSDYTNIIQEINTNIPDNTDQAITARKVRTTLIDMIDAVDDNMTEAIGEISVPTKTSDLTNDSGFITASALDGFATESYVSTHVQQSQSYMTGYVADYVATHSGQIDLGAYVSKDELSAASYATTSFVDDAIADAVIELNIPTKTSDLTNDSGFITATSLNGLATEQYVNTAVGTIVIPTKTSDLTNDSGFITSIPDEYVTESELNSMSYVSHSELSSLGYVTQTELSNAGYLTSIPSDYATYDAISQMGYITSSDIPVIPVIDESIIPKATSTYTLGDSTHVYDATYSRGFYTRTNNLTGFENNNNYTSIYVRVGGNIKLDVNSTDIRPTINKNYSLGTAKQQFSYTYSTNFIENGTDINDIYTQTKVVTQAEYDALTTSEKNSETLWIISDQQSYFDNEIVTEQTLSQKGFLTANNFQYDATTGTLTLIL